MRPRAKLDLQSAYRKVPEHPDDQALLGMACRGRTFCDRALPFGLRSAPKLFNAVADGLSWALHCEGIANLLHYLDDFFFWSEAGSSDCTNALSITVPLCGRLGLPVGGGPYYLMCLEAGAVGPLVWVQRSGSSFPGPPRGSRFP